MNRFDQLYNLIMEEISKDYTVKILNCQEIKYYIDNDLIDNQNPKIKDFKQIEKHLYTGSLVFWYSLFDNENNLRACAGCINKENNILYIAEFDSFKSSYGSILLHHILNLNYSCIYLLSNPEDNEGLLGYYRRPEFGLSEYSYNTSSEYKDIHYFYLNKSLSTKDLEKVKDKDMNWNKNKIIGKPITTEEVSTYLDSENKLKSSEEGDETSNVESECCEGGAGIDVGSVMRSWNTRNINSEFSN